ncbi:hypothetical protein C2G38_2254908 [Gigaspora rosea]|uniref:Uncharacterized protein n=1 Tax=Gigaspora rosea TaxID=44941 RepID=A0A397U3J3_9GLOM|nr:hypothetical protein C2G38_2254908 [Gigaspora rosea]
MGRNSPSLDNLRNENGVLQGNGASIPKRISFQDDDCVGGQNNNDEYEKFASPNDSQCNGINERREDRKIYVRGVSPYVTKDQQVSSTVEGENPIIATILGATVPNRCLGGQYMDERRTEDTMSCCGPECSIYCTEARIPETMSHVPKGEEQDEPREGRNSEKFPLMIVEMVAYKSDRKRVANSLNCKLQGGDIPSCICYMEHVKEYYDPPPNELTFNDSATKMIGIHPVAKKKKNLKKRTRKRNNIDLVSKVMGPIARNTPIVRNLLFFVTTDYKIQMFSNKSDEYKCIS